MSIKNAWAGGNVGVRWHVYSCPGVRAGEASPRSRHRITRPVEYGADRLASRRLRPKIHAANDRAPRAECVENLIAPPVPVDIGLFFQSTTRWPDDEGRIRIRSGRGGCGILTLVVPSGCIAVPGVVERLGRSGRADRRRGNERERHDHPIGIRLLRAWRYLGAGRRVHHGHRAHPTGGAASQCTRPGLVPRLVRPAEPRDRRLSVHRTCLGCLTLG